MPFADPQTFAAIAFDYLVIGGGTAGLVIASRLSALPAITVGVVEAGPASYHDPLVTVPGRFGEALGGALDWSFETVPQPALHGRRLQWPRGRLLGGTSALNFMTWTRGNKQDYDAWEELGNAGWGWDSMLPFFKKTESLHQSSVTHQQTHQSYVTETDHGKDGPVATVHSKEYSVPHQHWHATLNSLGLATNTRHFGGSNIGAFTTLTSVDPASRSRVSSATAYCLPNIARENLHVLVNATVDKIELERHGNDWQAIGVTFSSGVQRFTAKADCEVVVCAGSVQSPQVLELSGIGNADILHKAGVSVKVHNRNVGENLQEHMMTAMIFELDPTLSGPDELRADPHLAKAAQQAYDTSRTGIYAMLPCALSYAPLAQVVSRDNLEQILSKLPPAAKSRDEVLRKQFDQKTRGQIEYLFDVGNWSPYYKSSAGKVYGTMLMMLQLPLSRGSIHIPTDTGREPTIYDKPVINPRYFEGHGGEADFEIMSECQKFADKICKTAPLSSVIRKRVYPPESTALSGGEEFRPWVRESCITDWHPIGTCAMGGHEGIESGVVDDRLRVYGVKGLRVADASVMPLHICSHPQATVYAIGEKAASMILEDREAGLGETRK
ncbi:putative choline dehydrogenase [Polyplosphaeria fusca]|uniref:Choline dehydrogenase n=1 Tax=Polyplosphaeria fusca TaxID=682080 RepID=A0A9P4V2W7_9PLEO|nr:putative choline dehydrogenase [Polyplosphaeria fusca]